MARPMGASPVGLPDMSAASGTLLGAARTWHQLRYVARADLRAFRRGLVGSAVCTGLLCGAFVWLMYSTVARAVLPSFRVAPLDGAVDVPSFAAPATASGEGGRGPGSRFATSDSHVLAYAPASEPLASRVAHGVAALSGIGAARVRGFETRRDMEVFALDHAGTSDAVGAGILLGIGPARAPEAAPPSVSQLLPAGSRAVNNYTLYINGTWTTPPPERVWYVPATPCPIAALERYPTPVCSGSLSLHLLVSAVVANATGADLGLRLPPAAAAGAGQGHLVLPQLRVQSLAGDVATREEEEQADMGVGFSYVVPVLMTMASLMNSMVVAFMHNRRGGKEEHDANTSAAAYVMMKLAGMSDAVWWGGKLTWLVAVGAGWAGATALVAAVAGVTSGTTGGAVGLFAVLFAGFVSSAPLFLTVIAIPGLNNPYNTIARGITSLGFVIAPLIVVSITYWGLMPSGLLPLQVACAVISPATMAQGIALALSTGIDTASGGGTFTVGNVVAVLLFVCLPLNLYLAVRLDNATGGSPSESCLGTCGNACFGACCGGRRRTGHSFDDRGASETAVVVTRMTKTFRSWDGPPCCWCCKRRTVRAVRDVSLSFPVGQVTALLGPNGAGKSTLINCLLGLHPHEGGVSMFGLSVAGGVHARAAAGVGYVPQGNSLTATMSPKEHIELFAAMHGARDVEGVAQAVLRVIGLDSPRHCNTPASKLSGGQKRRLALGIAVLGDPRVLVLDEPTAGVDAAGKVDMRRLIRDLKRAGRVIVLTSHAMSEVEVLADYTAIMAHGKLRIEGVTTDLKRAWGAGYYLHTSRRIGTGVGVGVGDHTPVATESKSDGDGGGGEVASRSEPASPVPGSDAWTRALVASHVRGAVIVRRTMLETVFVLPMHYVDAFPLLFEALDNSPLAGHWGIEMPSLEEIFIRITREADELEMQEARREESARKAVKDKGKDKHKATGEGKDAGESKDGERAEGTQCADAGESKTVPCPGIGCGADLNVPSDAITLQCSSCHAVISKSDLDGVQDASGGPDDKPDKPEHGGGTGGAVAPHTAIVAGAPKSAPDPSLQPNEQSQATVSRSTQLVAFVRYALRVDRDTIVRTIYILVLYVAIAVSNASLGVQQQEQALLEWPKPVDGVLGTGRHVVGVGGVTTAVAAAAVEALEAAWGADEGGHVRFWSFGDNHTLLQTCVGSGGWRMACGGTDDPKRAQMRGGLHIGAGGLANATLLARAKDDAGLHAMLTVWQRALHPGLNLTQPLAMSVQPAREGPRHMVFRSSALVAMYAGILLFVLAQSLGSTPAADLEKGRKNQLLAMGLHRSVYFAGVLSLHVAMSLLFVLVWFVAITVADLPFAAETSPLALIIVLLIPCISSILIAYTLVFTLRTAEGFNVAFGMLLVPNMAVGMTWSSLPADVPALVSYANLIPGGALSQAFVVMDRAAGTAQFRAATGCSTCGFARIDAAAIFSPEGLLAEVALPLLECLVIGAALVLIERRDARKEMQMRNPKPLAGGAAGSGAAAVEEGDDDGLAQRASLSVHGVEMAFPSTGRDGADDDDGRRHREPCAPGMRSVVSAVARKCGTGAAADAAAGPSMKQVLNGLTFSVRPGEILALLGPNGAGKSTAFNIIAGSLGAQAGDVRFGGASVKTEAGRAQRQRRLYVAQQHTDSSLAGGASVRDHLQLYAAIKGVRSGAAREAAVQAMIDLFDLGDKATVPVKRLSGGQGRKGCAAVAMLGTRVDSSGLAVALLDEISAGVDVSARRRMWASLTRCSGLFAGVLCTHHLEEADTLCNRIAVLVRGRIVALGSSMDLKAEYGGDFQLHVTCAPASLAGVGAANDLEAYLREQVAPGVRLLDASPGSGHCLFSVPAAAPATAEDGDGAAAAPPTPTRLGPIFAALEAAKREGAHGLRDYSLAQPTLESVFMRLVRRFDVDGGEAALARSASLDST